MKSSGPRGCSGLSRVVVPLVLVSPAYFGGDALHRLDHHVSQKVVRVVHISGKNLVGIAIFCGVEGWTAIYDGPHRDKRVRREILPSVLLQRIAANFFANGHAQR